MGSDQALDAAGSSGSRTQTPEMAWASDSDPQTSELAWAHGSGPLAVYLDLSDLDPTPGMALLGAAGFRVAHTDLEHLSDSTGAQALLVGYDHIGEQQLELLPELKVIATHSAGCDMLDLEACARRGILVANVPGAATEEVATHALAMALALIRALPQHDRLVKRGVWAPAPGVTLRRPSRLTCGVVGMGRIGQRFSTLAAPVFGRVVGYDPQLPDGFWPAGVERLELQQLLEISELVSLHAPLTAETAHLIDADALALMPDGSYLVNASRGPLVDEQALLDALNSGRLAGAALDVLEHEPPRPGFALGTLETVLLTPHIGFLSAEAETDYVELPARNVISWLRTGTPTDLVAVP